MRFINYFLIRKYLVKLQIVLQEGISFRCSMNRSGKTNAKQGPMVNYNAYKDCHDREFEAHALASFMTFVGMKTMEGNFFS